jgi:anti-anti-sigma factor
VWLVTKCQFRDSGLDIHDIYVVLYESSFSVPQFWKEETAVSVLEISPLPGVPGMRLAGELDLATAPLLTEALLDLASERDVHLDLALLTFLDSSGLHAITALARSQDGDRSVVLLNPSAAVRRSLEIAGIDQHPAVEIRQPNAETVAA